MSTRNNISTILGKVLIICVFLITSVTVVFATEEEQSICINEIMQSNINTVFVGMDFPDSWVELYNPTDRDIGIYHYYIGASPNYKENFRIKEIEAVPAEGYMLVYFDKEATGMHTNIRLNSVDPGILYLFNERGVLIDSLAYPAMPAPNIAYARDTDGAKSWHYVCQATPGAPNTGEASDLVLPLPLFSTCGHVMTDSEILTVSIPDETALPSDTRLYLTFDGSEPDMSAICVAGRDTTFLVDKTTVVRARLISTHALCPPSWTESYIFHPRPTDMPIISLATDDAYLYSSSFGIFSHDTIPGNTKPNYSYDWRRPLNMEYLGSHPDAPSFNQLGETGMYGMSTRSAQQKSMKLISNKRFGTKHLKGCFWPEVKPDIKKQKTVCIRSCTSGRRIIEGPMQNWFGMHMPDLDYQAFSPAIIYINGIYKGFMGLREKSDEDYVWANYDKLEDIEMITSLTATKPASFKKFRDAVLADSITYEEASLIIDMANTADMVAINIICNNTDWPYNNVSLWRPTEEGGKWRWIMKDMDQINSTHRCKDPLTFNYLKYLTNTGEPGSQEENINQIASFIWPRVQLLGKLVVMPGFRDALVDRLMVFMGDFMRGDILQNYMEAQFAILDPEVTPSLQMLKAGDKNTFYKAIEKNVVFFYEHPAVVYQYITDFYHFGDVIPMTTINNGLPVSVNDIPLTEGNFNGACFSDRAIRLNSGDENTGWIMHIRGAGNVVNRYGFESPAISIYPRDYIFTAEDKILSIEFETCPTNDLPASVTTTFHKQISSEIDAIYTYDGKKTSNPTKMPYIIRYTDGHTKKAEHR